MTLRPDTASRHDWPGAGVDRAKAELAETAASLVIESGLEYEQAKRQAARDLGRRATRHGELPANELVEQAVRAQLALFHADTQPGELRALRETALGWMKRLAAFRPHLAGAAWRGTATRRNAVTIELYADDAKSCEIAVLNLGLDLDVAELERRGRDPATVFRAAVPCPALGEPVTLLIHVLDLDDLRGALLPDACGRSWRGSLPSLERVLAGEGPRP